MRTGPACYDTDNDSIGWATEDTQSTVSEWEEEESELDSEYDSTGDPSEEHEIADVDLNSDPGSDSGAESDCTAIPDEAFGFDEIDSESDPSVSTRELRRMYLNERGTSSDERLLNMGTWVYLWRLALLDTEGTCGFLSSVARSPASVYRYRAEEYVMEADVSPHPTHCCRVAQVEGRLRPMPNARTLRLFVQYTAEGPTLHGAGESPICPALSTFAPVNVVLRGVSLASDDIPLDLWIPRLERMEQLVFVVEPGPTIEQLHKQRQSPDLTPALAGIAADGLKAIIRSRPTLHFTVVFNTYPGRPWQGDCLEPVTGILADLLANVAGIASVVGYESLTRPSMEERLENSNKTERLRKMKYALNRAIFERKPDFSPPQYYTTRYWMDWAAMSKEVFEKKEAAKMKGRSDMQRIDNSWDKVPDYDRGHYEREAKRLEREARHNGELTDVAEGASAGRPTEADVSYWADLLDDPSAAATTSPSDNTVTSEGKPKSKGPTIVQRGFHPTSNDTASPIAPTNPA